MALNFSNMGQQALENLLPIFQSMANGVVMPSNANFINHLNAVNSSKNNKNNINPPTKECKASNRTPEPPPAPRLSPLNNNNIKPNKGTVPMDLDNDLDNEHKPITSSNNNSNIVPTNNTTLSSNSMMLNMPDASLYLNGLMANSALALNAGLMFFPTPGAATTTNNNQTTSVHNNNIQTQLDASAMMAVAMQQMQQNYTGNYTLPPDVATMDKNKTTINTDNLTNNTLLPVKEVIKTKNCILLPPNPNAPPPTIRDRPPGCRTVFVGGLPENITEEILREIFESCGDITTLRMSKKNFCHIRFRNEESIDQAIFLSGYRIRLNNNNEPANCGRLHVDYAQARDDQYDYECRQRQLQRQQRHREHRRSHERSNSESNSPPPIPHYSDHEAALVTEQLRNNNTFIKAMQTMTVWLERGDCNKRNANIFYSMIQSSHSHVRRLTSDKQLLEEELQKARDIYRKQMLTITSQFTQIEKMFNAASHKKVWDHFTKAQRKSIDQWKKLATALRSIQIDDDEMETSDDNYHHDYNISRTKRKRYESDHLKEENDSLRCQLEAIRNEMSCERTDIRYNSEFREKQIKVLQETIRNMQTQLIQTKIREQKDNKIIEQLQRRLKEAGVKQLLLKTKIRETTEKLKDRESHNEHDNNEIISIDADKSDDEVKIIEDEEFQTDKDDIFKNNIKSIINDNQTIVASMDNEADEVIKSSSNATATIATVMDEKPFKEIEEKLNQSLPLDDAKLIALATAFLLVQPLGCTTAAICSYIKTITNNQCLECNQLNIILQKYENLFQSELINNRNNIIWKFCGFTTTTSLASSSKNKTEIENELIPSENTN